MQAFLPYGRQSIDESDIAAVTDVLRSDWLTGGPAVERFERLLCQQAGARHAVACANGTAALHLAAMAIGLGPGDVAVVPTMTFLATANAVRFVGAEAVFADVDPESGLMRSTDLEAAIAWAGVHFPQHRIGAVLPVHLVGQPASLSALAAIAKTHEAAMIADCSHALGTGFADESGQRRVGDGYYENAATFSFHPVKTIAMGEGGAVTTNDPVLAARMAKLRNHGMTRDPTEFSYTEQAMSSDGTPNPWYYEMQDLGYNYRASDIHCALGASQLSKLQQFLVKRRELVDQYDGLLKPYAPVIRPIARVGSAAVGWHLYVVLIDYEHVGVSRARIVRELQAAQIGTQVHYLPVHRQPYYRARYGEQSLPGADAYYERALSLPLHVSMTSEDVRHVVTVLARALRIN